MPKNRKERSQEYDRCRPTDDRPQSRANVLHYLMTANGNEDVSLSTAVRLVELAGQYDWACRQEGQGYDAAEKIRTVERQVLLLAAAAGAVLARFTRDAPGAAVFLVWADSTSTVVPAGEK